MVNIRKTYDLPFSAERVYSAWISDEYSVSPVTSTQVDPRIGGIFKLKMGSGEQSAEMSGEILQIEPGRHLKYTWHWGGDDAPSIVDATFSEYGEGCRIVVNHTGLESQESVTAHEGGWDSYLSGLEQVLKQH